MGLSGTSKSPWDELRMVGEFPPSRVSVWPWLAYTVQKYRPVKHQSIIQQCVLIQLIPIHVHVVRYFWYFLEMFL